MFEEGPLPGCTLVLADVSKLGATAPSWTQMPGPWTLVTDAVSDELAADCARHGVDVLTP